jgi:hypothetical protein
LIEDDYDSEFQFSGRPIPALKGMTGAEHVFLLGMFNKVLFPTLRMGYIVAPDQWLDPYFGSAGCWSVIPLFCHSARSRCSLPKGTMDAICAGFGHYTRGVS